MLAVYQDARRWALANPNPFASILAAETRLADAVVARQLERTNLPTTVLGAPERDAIPAAGFALQKAGVIDPAASIPAAVDALVETDFASRGG